MKLPTTMRAMVLDQPGEPLRMAQLPLPEPGLGQVLLQVRTCGVCRTDLHIADGDLPPVLPGLVLGHEIVGTVVGRGPRATRFPLGERVGVPWLGRTCGRCRFCRREQENLCEQPAFTGYSRHGGYAEFTVADEAYCLPLLGQYGDLEAAPLLCAGLIGYRAYRLAGAGIARLGIFGFGAAAHIITPVAIREGVQVYAFTRPGGAAGQAFALQQGVAWAGGSDETPPEPLDAAIIFAPVGSLVPAALAAVDKGGVVVCGGIHMSDIPSFPYRLLWEERVVRSVANLTRQDGERFMAIAGQVTIPTTVQAFPLHEANEALQRLRAGQLTGAAVLVP